MKTPLAFISMTDDIERTVYVNPAHIVVMESYGDGTLGTRITLTGPVQLIVKEPLAVAVATWTGAP